MSFFAKPAPRTTGERLDKILMAFLVSSLITCGLSVRQGSAAEISCVSTWGQIGDFRQDQTKWEEYYPSGRRPLPSSCTEALLRGEIAVGDFERFRSLLQANQPFLARLMLWSPGGSVDEAMKIGRLVRKSMLVTEAPTGKGLGDGSGTLFSLMGHRLCDGADCNCASACFLIWAGGIERHGWAIGLHRPSSKSTSFGNLPSEQASVLYRELLQQIESYLEEMEVPRKFIEIMTVTSSTKVRWLDVSESNLIENVPSIAEWINASCGTDPFEREIDDLSRGRTSLKDFSAREKIEWQRLVNRSIDKQDELWRCKADKIDRSRDATTQASNRRGMNSPKPPTAPSAEQRAVAGNLGGSFFAHTPRFLLHDDSASYGVNRKTIIRLGGSL
jgi:hypothetical protein